MQQEVLKKRRSILGDRHPGVISAMENPAITLSGGDLLDEAASIKQEVLKKEITHLKHFTRHALKLDAFSHQEQWIRRGFREP